MCKQSSNEYELARTIMPFHGYVEVIAEVRTTSMVAPHHAIGCAVNVIQWLTQQPLHQFLSIVLRSAWRSVHRCRAYAVTLTPWVTVPIYVHAACCQFCIVGASKKIADIKFRVNWTLCLPNVAPVHFWALCTTTDFAEGTTTMFDRMFDVLCSVSIGESVIYFFLVTLAAND